MQTLSFLGILKQKKGAHHGTCAQQPADAANLIPKPSFDRRPQSNSCNFDEKAKDLCSGFG
jgi:hypothetical protein